MVHLKNFNAKKDLIMVTNIQRFSLHDGPGIRTTVFLKGCTLRCPWCSNPENISNYKQKYVKDGKEGLYGKGINCDELYIEVMRDSKFYTGQLTDYAIFSSDDLEKLPGGVTFSGGEALLQINELEPLLIRLRDKHIHTAVETCLYVPQDYLELALKYIDLFYFDIKILNKQRVKEILHTDIETYFANLNILKYYSDIYGKPKPIVARVPVIGGYTDDEENIEFVIELISRIKPLKVELLKEHNLGIAKYNSLNLIPPEYKGVTDEFMKEYKSRLDKVGIMTEICNI